MADRPPAFDVDGAVQQILDLHRQHGGATFSLHAGSLAGQRLYAVSPYPRRSRKLASEVPSAAILKRFIEENFDLLADPRHCVGTWFSPESGVTYLDVSIVVEDRQEAIAMGRRYNQEGIYDLAAGQEIPTGGTGD